MLNSSGC